MWALAGIFLFALVLRLAAVGIWGAPPKSDALQYHSIAVNLVTGHGYSLQERELTSSRPPAYPVLLASIYALTGTDYRHALYVQALLHAALVLPLFWFGRRLSSSVFVGLAAAGLFAVHPSLEIVSRLYAENLLIVLALGLVITMYMALQQPGTGLAWALAGGIFAGLMGLTKPEMALLGVGVLVFGLLWPTARAHWRRLSIVAMVSVLMVGAWQARNLSIEDHKQNDLVKYTLFLSYYPALSGSWWWPVTDMQALDRERGRAYAYLSQYSQDQITKALGEAITDHPLGFVKLAASRVIILWASPPVGSSTLASISATLKWPALIMQYVFVAAGLAMLLWSVAKKLELLPVLALVLYMTLVYGLAHAIRRYGYPFIPELCLFAVWGAWSLRLRRQKDIRKGEIGNSG